MKQEVKIGQTDYTVLMLVRDTAGAPKTGLVFNSAGIDICYTRVETDNDVVLAAGAPVDLVTPALTDPHLDWGFLQVDATNAPGLYRVDLPDGVFASGAWSAIVSFICTGCDPVHLEFMLIPDSPYSTAMRGTDSAALAATALSTATWTPARAGYLDNINNAALQTTVAQTGDSYARIGVNGAGLSNINLPNQAMDITGNITGNLSGSVGSVTGAVGSVTGAVGSVTGAVGSVTGNVGGNVVGTVASVVGAVGSVAGNVDGNVTGTVGSVIGAVGSVAGAVGSVIGNVGGNVVGTVASVVGAVGSVAGNVGGNVVGTVASVVGNVGGNVNGNVVGSVGSVAGAVGSVTGDVGGDVLGSVASLVGHTPQTGDSFVRIGALGAGLTALGDARLANLDAAISTRGTADPGDAMTLTAAYDDAMTAAQAGDAMAVGVGGIQSVSYAANARDAAGQAADVGVENATAVWASVARTLTSAVSFQIKKNVQLNSFPFVMTDNVNHNPIAAEVVTATRSIDGGVFGACANAVVEIGAGWYEITLAAADLNGDTIALRFTSAGADDLNITMVTQS